ncbi:MAG: hypothetical protein M3Z04_13640 [Chloroflexota bacterium]|nr:hypothetical protein [Chloroflexota bacterium]
MSAPLKAERCAGGTMPRPSRRVLSVVCGAFLVTRVITVLAGSLGLRQQPGATSPGNLWVAAGRLWDGGWYMSLARDGYQAIRVRDGGPLAFPPLLPVLVRALAAGLRALGIKAGGTDEGTVALAGLLISNVAFGLALVVVWYLVWRDHPAAVADRTVWLLAAFPLGVFWSAVYTESLFLLLTVSCVLAARQGQWPSAGLLGALAVLTRWPGILLLAVLLTEWVAQARVPSPGGLAGTRIALTARAGRALGWIGLLPLTLGSYMGYLQIRFGNGFGMIQAHAAGWREGLSFFPGTYSEGVSRLWQHLTQMGTERELVRHWGRGSSVYMWLDLGLPLLFAGLGVLGWRRAWLRPSDLLWLGLGISFALSWNTTLSVGRYMMPLWPALIVGARLCVAHPALERIWLAGAGTLLALTAYLFAHWQWIG